MFWFKPYFKLKCHYNLLKKLSSPMIITTCFYFLQVPSWFYLEVENSSSTSILVSFQHRQIVLFLKCDTFQARSTNLQYSHTWSVLTMDGSKSFHGRFWMDEYPDYAPFSSLSIKYSSFLPMQSNDYRYFVLSKQQNWAFNEESRLKNMVMYNCTCFII